MRSYVIQLNDIYLQIRYKHIFCIGGCSWYIVQYISDRYIQKKKLKRQQKQTYFKNTLNWKSFFKVYIKKHIKFSRLGLQNTLSLQRVKTLQTNILIMNLYYQIGLLKFWTFAECETSLFCHYSQVVPARVQYVGRVELFYHLLCLKPFNSMQINDYWLIVMLGTL